MGKYSVMFTYYYTPHIHIVVLLFLSKLVVIDKAGKLLRITKEQYYAQIGSKINWEWIMTIKATFQEQEKSTKVY